MNDGPAPAYQDWQVNLVMVRGRVCVCGGGSLPPPLGSCKNPRNSGASLNKFLWVIPVCLLDQAHRLVPRQEALLVLPLPVLSQETFTTAPRPGVPDSTTLFSL